MCLSMHLKIKMAAERIQTSSLNSLTKSRKRHHKFLLSFFFGHRRLVSLLLDSWQDPVYESPKISHAPQHAKRLLLKHPLSLYS